MTPLFALTKRDRCFGAFVTRSFIGDFFFFFFRGPCLYFTRGYIGFRLVKNLTPSAPEWTLESFPVRKRVRALWYIVLIYMRKEENLFYEPLRLFPSGGFYTLPYT